MTATVRALVFLLTTARVRLPLREPRSRYVEIAGVPAVVLWPHRRSRGTIVFLNGGTRLGCGHPAVQRLACGIARAGYTAIVPELPGLKDGRLTPATLDATIAVAAAMSRKNRVALFGVSAGASLALLAAADPALEGRVTVVVGLAPWADLAAVIRLATTGRYDGVHRDTTPLVREFIASSLPATLAEGHALSDAIERLSPLRVVHRLQIPVEIASAADDGYFPLGEAQKLVTAAPNARLTVTSLLDHVRLRLTARDIRDAVRFCRFTARSFAAVTDTSGGTR